MRSVFVFTFYFATDTETPTTGVVFSFVLSLFFSIHTYKSLDILLIRTDKSQPVRTV